MNENHGSGADRKALAMADLIERWIGNPISRTFLVFMTRRVEGGRRIEKLLEDYAGLDVELSPGDRVVGYLFRLILDGVLGRMDLTENVRKQLRVGYWRKGLASVLEGLAWRGPEKPFTAYCPFLVVWNFTDSCNLHCKHCYQEALGGPSPDELTTDEAIDAVDTMADAGVAYIAMSGGEPLIRRDFFQVADRIKERDMAFSVATNGTLLSRKTVERLQGSGCLFVQVSIDGMRETHDKFRGTRCFDRALQGIRNAVDSRMFIGVAMSVTRHNLHEVGEVIDLTEELGADIFMHYNFIPVGRGKEIVEEDISPYERESLLEMLASNSRKRGVTLLSTAPQYSRVCTGYGILSLTHFDTFGQHKGRWDEIQFLAEFVGGCGAGRLYWALQPNGDLTPCVFIPIRLGNIMEDDFLEVWRTSKVLNMLRSRGEFKGSCGKCPSRNICGGCRARAYSYLNDIQESDPGCPMNNDKWVKIKKRTEDERARIAKRSLQMDLPWTASETCEKALDTSTTADQSSQHH